MEGENIFIRGTNNPKNKKDLHHAIGSSACRETGFVSYWTRFPFFTEISPLPREPLPHQIGKLRGSHGTGSTWRRAGGKKKKKKKKERKIIDGDSPELLDVGGDARQSINAVDDAVLLDELGAAFQHHRDWRGWGGWKGDTHKMDRDEIETFMRAIQNDSNLLSRPELSKCSPRSQPKTRSFRMPDCFSLRRDGLDKMKLLFRTQSGKTTTTTRLSRRRNKHKHTHTTCPFLIRYIYLIFCSRHFDQLS